MSDKSNSIHVDVKTAYLIQESQPDKSRYLFSYTITIKNHGSDPAILLSRYWKITGGDGHEQEVKGDGVIGLHPQLEPKQTFIYTSAAMLETAAWG